MAVEYSLSVMSFPFSCTQKLLSPLYMYHAHFPWPVVSSKYIINWLQQYVHMNITRHIHIHICSKYTVGYSIQKAQDC